MFDMVDTAFTYERALIVCQFLPEFSMRKESSLHEIWNADTAFFLVGAEHRADIVLGASCEKDPVKVLMNKYNSNEWVMA